MIHERYRFSDEAHIYDEKGRDTSTLSAPQIYEDQIHLRHYIRVHTLLQNSALTYLLASSLLPLRIINNQY